MIASMQDLGLALATPGLYSPPSKAAASTACSWLTDELEYIQTSFMILDVLESFGTHLHKEPPHLIQPRWIGKPKFLPHVFHHVRRHEPVQLTLPAFPCKSANRDNKVLSGLPDLGEELGLCRLNDIAIGIGRVYEHGARVNIASDGVLFNDVIGVSDEDTWEYGEKLLEIIKEKRLDNLVFTRPQVLLGMMDKSAMNRETYLQTVADCRTLLQERFGSSIEQVEGLIASDRDTTSTYCGMVKFLETELLASLSGKALRQRKKIQKETAKKMMQRSEAFTLAIRSLCPHDVRLSMHPSSGAAKLSVALVPSPSGSFQKSPWHSCVAIQKDGSYLCAHSDEVRDTHTLMYKEGRPYFYIAKDALTEEATESAVEESPQNDTVPDRPPTISADSEKQQINEPTSLAATVLDSDVLATMGVQEQSAVVVATKESIADAKNNDGAVVEVTAIPVFSVNETATA